MRRITALHPPVVVATLVAIVVGSPLEPGCRRKGVGS